MDEELKLLDCPFCGEKARLCEGSAMWWVQCTAPGCDGEQCHDTKEQAIAAWNTRTSPPVNSLHTAKTQAKVAVAIGEAMADQEVELSNPQLLYVALKALDAVAASLPAEAPVNEEVVERVAKAIEREFLRTHNVPIAKGYATTCAKAALASLNLGNGVSVNVTG